MRNILETVSVGLVILLSLGLVGLVVRYNMIDTTETAQLDTEVMHSLQNSEVPVTKEKKVSNYLNTLEAYKDVDVKVDPKSQPSNENIATVKTEIKKDGSVGNIGNVVQTTEKNENYVQNLESYNPAQQKNDANTAKPKSDVMDENATEDEAQLKEDPMGNIANDIDAIIDDSEKEQ